MKFDEAYCTYTHNILHLSELIDIRIKDKQIFYKYYASQLYCPECLVAPLLFINANPPHLRTKEKIKHGENCSMQQPVISTKKLESYCDKKENYDSIYRRLENAHRQIYLNRKINLSNNPFVLENKDTFKSESNTSLKHNKKSFKIPRRNIKNVTEDDLNTYKIFYGQVHLKWYDKEDWTSGYLNLLNPKTNKTICSIKMTKNVFEYISKYVSLTNASNLYNIFFLSKLAVNDNQPYYHAKIPHSSFIYIEKS